MGQIYVGKVTRGLVFLIFGLIVGLIAALSIGPFAWIINVIIWAAAAYDAYTLAQKYNRYIDKHGEAPW